MTGPRRLHARSSTRAGERQVANAVHRLMSHEFIRPAKRILDNPLVADDDSILRRRAADQAFRPQFIYLVHEAERTRPRQLFLEAFGRNFVPPVLLADQGMR